MRPERASTTAPKLTAHDVAFTLKLLKERVNPIIAQLLRDFRGRGGGGRRNARRAAFAPKRARDVRCSWRSFRSSRAPTTEPQFEETSSIRRSAPAPTRSAASTGTIVEYQRVGGLVGRNLPL